MRSKDDQRPLESVMTPLSDIGWKNEHARCGSRNCIMTGVADATHVDRRDNEFNRESEEQQYPFDRSENYHQIMLDNGSRLKR